MNINIARDMNAAGHVAGIVFARRVQFGGHGGHIAVVPDGVGAANGQAGAVGGHAHGFGEGTEVGVEDAPVSAYHNDFACLVGGDDDAEVEALKESGQVGGMHAAQGRVWWRWWSVGEG